MRAATISAVIATFLALTSSYSIAQDGTTDIVPWQTDLDKAMQLAKERNKPLLIHFWAPTCGPCLKLDKHVFSKNSVAQTLSDYFIPVKIDGSAKPAIRASYRVEQYPTDVIVLPNNEVVHRMATPQSPERYIHQLTAIAFRTGTVAKQQPAVDRYTTPDRYTAKEDYKIDEAPLAKTEFPKKPDNRFDKYRERYGTYADEQVAFNDNSSQNGPVGSRQREVTNPYARAAKNASPTPSPDQSGAATRSANTIVPPRSQQQSRGSYEQIANADSPDSGSAVDTPRTDSRVKPSMEGYCPVTLLKKEAWKKGNPRLGAIHRGRLFLFVGESEKRAFLADPDRYSPVLAGVDPVELTERGRVLEGHRAHGVVYRDQVFLFVSEKNLELFWNSPDRYTTTIIQAMQSTPNGTLLR